MMAKPLVIDADSHVEEPVEAWEYLDREFQNRKPFPVVVPNRPILANLNAFWWVDGQIYPRISGPGHTVYGTPPESAHAKNKAFSVASQTLATPADRLKDMDRAGVDIQVVFPTVFLEPLTEDIRFEAALMRSYNTWISRACREAPDRLKWAAVIPLRNVAAAVDELKRTRELGAVAGAIYGTVGEKMLDQPEFDPFFAEAERLSVPVCIHTGWSHPGLKASGTTIMAAHVVTFTLPVLMGFYAVLAGGVLDRFPGLKVAFLEAGADWVPYLIQRMDHYYRAEKALGRPGLPERIPSAYLGDREIYFTCEGDEELLPLVLERVGDDRMMISADMPHAEAREGSVKEIQERGDLTEAQKRKILGENARRFYSL